MKILRFFFENLLAAAGLMLAGVSLAVGLNIYAWGGWRGFLTIGQFLHTGFLPTTLDTALWAGVFLILGLLFFNYQKSIPALKQALLLRLGISILLVPVTGLILGLAFLLILH